MNLVQGGTRNHRVTSKPCKSVKNSIAEGNVGGAGRDTKVTSEGGIDDLSFKRALSSEQSCRLRSERQRSRRTRFPLCLARRLSEFSPRDPRGNA